MGQQGLERTVRDRVKQGFLLGGCGATGISPQPFYRCYEIFPFQCASP